MKTPLQMPSSPHRGPARIAHARFFRLTRKGAVALTVILLFAFFAREPYSQSSAQAGSANVPEPLPTLVEIQSGLAKRKSIAQSSFVNKLSLLGLFHSSASGSVSLPPLAPFQGNLTAIKVPDLLGLGRLKDCSLDEEDATFRTTMGSFSYSLVQTTPHFELTLHNNSFLTTTPDQFKGGCNDTTLGLYSRLAMYVGKTADGGSIIAAAVGTAALESNDDIGVFVVSPQGTLTSMKVYATDSQPDSIAVGDLNADGQNDVVSVNNSSITVLLGNPDGTFQAGVNYDLTPGTRLGTIAIDDVTGDGKLDVIVSEGSQFAIYPGRGDGTLGDPQLTTAAGPTNYLVTGDFNGDGKKDIATGIGQIFLNNGSGFTAVSALAFPASTQAGGSTYYQGEYLGTGDFNKDGKLDLAVENGLTGAVDVFLGKGDGTFSGAGSYALPSGADLVVTDLDGDGNLDLYFGLGNSAGFGGEIVSTSSAYALLGKGDGTFQGAPSKPFSYYGPQTIGVTGAASASTGNVFDLNGDKKLDVLMLTGSSAARSLAFTAYLGNGDGTFNTGPSSAVPSTYTSNGSQFPVTGVTSYAIADFNGDEIPDLVYGVGTGYLVALGNGDGSFKTPVFVGLDGDADGITSADFNHDGKADLMYYVIGGAAGESSEEVLQLGNGDGTFQQPILVPLSGGTPDALQISSGVTSLFDISPAVIGDVNGDGIPDLLTLQESGATYQLYGQTQPAEQIAVYLGKGDGTFQSPIVAPAADNPSTADNPQGVPLLADMNGDGKPDLISTGVNTNGLQELAISIGNGDGTFQKPAIYLPKTYSVNALGNLTVADFNGDGKLDITFNDGVFLGNGDGTLQVSANSDGTCAPTQRLGLISYAESSFAGDFNGDGRPDLLNFTTLLLNEYGVAIAGSSASTTSLTVAPNPAAVGQSITFTATVAAGSGASGTPTGTVTFLSGSTSLGTGTLSSGSATFSTSSLAAGTYSITASYGGDSTFAASTSAAVSVTVNAAPVTIATTTTLTASATTAVVGTSLTFTADVTPASGSGVPGGSVAFTDGTTQLGTGTLDGTGKATYSTSSLAVGTHSISAAYGGNTSYTASTSTPVSVTITAAPADFSISLAPTSGTVSQTGSVTSAITIASANGFNQAVSLSCSGAPRNAACSVSPASVTPSGTSPGTATLTIQTGTEVPAFKRLTSSGRSSISIVSVVLSCCGFFSLSALRRRRRPGWTTLLAAVALCCGLVGTVAGCGGSSHSTPSGTYTITVTATIGADSHTATYGLTVQ